MAKKVLKCLIIGIFMLIGVLDVHAADDNIVAAYIFDTSSCKTGEEVTCQKTECYKNKETCSTGTIIKYKVNDNEQKYFYVIKDTGTTIIMQQRENTVSEIEWHYTQLNPDNTQGSDTATTSLTNATADWNNINNVRMITYNEAINAGCNDEGCPEYLTMNIISNSDGYWTSDKSSDDTTTAWAISNGGLVKSFANSKMNGVRAVVEISKQINEETSIENNEEKSNTNNQNKTGTQVVEVSNTAKNKVIFGYIVGIFVLTAGIYIIYNSVKEKEIKE